MDTFLNARKEISFWSDEYDADRILEREDTKQYKGRSISRQIKDRITMTHEFELELEKYYIY